MASNTPRIPEIALTLKSPFDVVTLMGALSNAEILSDAV
jgi:hypothetical protein